jgi:protein SCO1/2
VMVNSSSIGEEVFGPGSGESLGLPDTNEPSVGVDDVVVTPASGRPSRRGLPNRSEVGANLGAGAAKDRARNDPLHVVGVHDVGGENHHGSGVLDSLSVNPVDGVGAGQPDVGVLTHGQITGEGAGVEHQQERSDSDGPTNPLHVSHPREGDDFDRIQEEALVIPRWVKIGGSVMVVFILAALAFAIFEPIQVLPRSGLAPGYSLTSQAGTSVNSESGRGTVTLYTFAPTDCDATCEAMNETMATVRDRVAAEVDLEGTEFRLVTIALNPVSDPQELQVAAAASGADGQTWQWLGGSESEIRTIVGAGFQRFYEIEEDGSIRFDPGFVLVDGAGVVRGEYRYQTLADDSDKITSHVSVLGEEIRYADGAAAIAYEAAHLFLCYP